MLPFKHAQFVKQGVVTLVPKHPEHSPFQDFDLTEDPMAEALRAMAIISHVSKCIVGDAILFVRPHEAHLIGQNFSVKWTERIVYDRTKTLEENILITEAEVREVKEYNVPFSVITPHIEEGWKTPMVIKPGDLDGAIPTVR